MADSEIKQIAVLSEEIVQQIQMFQQQQVILKTRISEIENALKELEKVPEEGVTYRVVGGVIIKMAPAKIKEDLTKEKEDLDIKLKMIESRISRLKKQLEELDARLRELLKKRT